MKPIILLLLLWSTLASANYAMDPQRKPDPAFTKFFLGRVDSWMRNNLYDYRRGLSKTDLAFIDTYLSHPRSLGEVKGAGFIRSYSYWFKVDRSRVTFGPFRFVQPSPSPSDLDAFVQVLKARKIAVPSDLIGLGFTSNPDEIEVITLGSDQLQRFRLFRAGKPVGVVIVERGVNAKTVCPVSPVNEQIDRVQDADGDHYAFHSSQSVEEAYSMEGRRLLHKIQIGLELAPGEIDYHSQLIYGLAYP